ncbi:MAG: hypothetical protein OXT67_12905 [Zetaproteobacteria bacterium]|nr:hypothetical protein [Zetaproteobacteria bacterium]
MDENQENLARSLVRESLPALHKLLKKLIKQKTMQDDALLPLVVEVKEQLSGLRVEVSIQDSDTALSEEGTLYQEESADSPVVEVGEDMSDEEAKKLLADMDSPAAEVGEEMWD